MYTRIIQLTNGYSLSILPNSILLVRNGTVLTHFDPVPGVSMEQCIEHALAEYTTLRQQEIETFAYISRLAEYATTLIKGIKPLPPPNVELRTWQR
jgi:hypothetical protein